MCSKFCWLNNGRLPSPRTEEEKCKIMNTLLVPQQNSLVNLEVGGPRVQTDFPN